MGSGDYLCDVFMGGVYVALVQYVCGLRGGKAWHFVLYGLSIISLIFSDYVFRLNRTEDDWPMVLLALVLELSNLIIVAYFAKGDFWKNLFILVCGSQMVSIVISVAKELDKTAEDVFYENLTTNIKMGFAEGVFYSIMEVLGGLLAIVVMSFLFRNKRDSKIYKYVSISLLTFAVASAMYRDWYNHAAFIDDASLKIFSAIFTATAVVPIVIAFHIIGLAHVKAEKKRMEQEISKLNHTIQDKCQQYENLAKTDQMLIKYKEEYEKSLRDKDDNQYAKALLENSENIKMQSWTGKLLVDSLLYSVNQKLQDTGIRFEYTIENIEDTVVTEEDCAYLFEQLIEIALILGELSEEQRYIVLSERKVDDNCVVKIDFSKYEGTKIKYDRKSIIVRQHKSKEKSEHKNFISRKKLKSMEEIVQDLNVFGRKYDSSFVLSDDGETGAISFILC